MLPRFAALLATLSLLGLAQAALRPGPWQQTRGHLLADKAVLPDDHPGRTKARFIAQQAKLGADL